MEGFDATRKNCYYVTTPLYYVNDKPHVGHAYKPLLNVLARWNRFLGKRGFLLDGDRRTRSKSFAAAKHNCTPLSHADTMTIPFQTCGLVSTNHFDDFIRTTQERHTSRVQAVLQYLLDKGDIYEDSYEGWYSTSVERFLDRKKDLVDGKCPGANVNDVEWISEKNTFFACQNTAT